SRAIETGLARSSHVTTSITSDGGTTRHYMPPARHVCALTGLLWPPHFAAYCTPPHSVNGTATMRVPLCFALASLLVACGDSAPTTSSTALLPDGGRYRGALVDGRLQGQGRLDYANGSFYEGEFKDGLFHGAGT